jgi:hypothetical protein
MEIGRRTASAAGVLAALNADFLERYDLRLGLQERRAWLPEG